MNDRKENIPKIHITMLCIKVLPMLMTLVLGKIKSKQFHRKLKQHGPKIHLYMDWLDSANQFRTLVLNSCGPSWTSEDENQESIHYEYMCRLNNMVLAYLSRGFHQKSCHKHISEYISSCLIPLHPPKMTGPTSLG